MRDSARRTAGACGIVTAAAGGIVTAAAAALLMRPALLRFVTSWDDDGLLGAHALTQLTGAVPYRDYFTPLPPGGELLYGLWVRIAGTSYISLRLLTATAVVGAAVFLYLIAVRFMPPALAVLAALTWSSWSAHLVAYGPYHHWATLLALAMAWALVRSAASEKPRRWLVVAGVLGGLAVTFLGAFVAVLLAGGLAAVLIGRARAAAWFGLGALLVVASVTIWLLATASLEPFLDQAVGFAAARYLPANALPIPWLPWMLLGAPGGPALLAGSGGARAVQALFWLGGLAAPIAVAVIGAIRGGNRAVAAARPVAIAGLVSFGLFLTGLYRPSAAVLWLSAPLAIGLGTAEVRSALSRVPAWARRSGRAVLGGVLMASIVFAAAAAQPFEPSPRGQMAEVRASDTRVAAYPSDAAMMRRVLALVENHPSDRVAFLPFLQALYPITGHGMPIRFTTLIPGYHTEQQVRAAVDELVARRVRWLVYASPSPGWLEAGLPGAAARGGGFPALEALLLEAYEPREPLGVAYGLGEVTLYELRAPG